jgi:hypothetical protein
MRMASLSWVLRSLGAFLTEAPDKYTALMIEAQEGHTDIVTMLIRAAMDVSYRIRQVGTSLAFRLHISVLVSRSFTLLAC